MEWKRKKYLKGITVHDLSENNIKYGHFTRIGNPNYVEDKSSNGRNLTNELSSNYSLESCCNKVSLSDLIVKN